MNARILLMFHVHMFFINIQNFMCFWIRSCEDPPGLISNWLCGRHRQTHTLESQIHAQDGCTGLFGNTPNVPILPWIWYHRPCSLLFIVKKNSGLVGGTDFWMWSCCWTWSPCTQSRCAQYCCWCHQRSFIFPSPKTRSVPLQCLHHNLQVFYIFPFGLIFLFLL